MSITARKAPQKGPTSEILNLGDDVQLERVGAEVKLTIGAETRSLPLAKLRTIVTSMQGLATRAAAARKS